MDNVTITHDGQEKTFPYSDIEFIINAIKSRENYLMSLGTTFYKTDDLRVYEAVCGSIRWTIDISNLDIRCHELDIYDRLEDINLIERYINTNITEYFNYLSSTRDKD